MRRTGSHGWLPRACAQQGERSAMPEGRGAGATSISGRITRRFLISGKVQGVYFRHSTRLQAERLGVRGVARNLPDGSVEVIAHGTRKAGESLRECLHGGPSVARLAPLEGVQ